MVARDLSIHVPAGAVCALIRIGEIRYPTSSRRVCRMIEAMSIAGRFGAALDDADDDLAGPELLPVRLSLACARTLAVDGAGLSVLDASRRRIPLGASSATAAVAE